MVVVNEWQVVIALLWQVLWNGPQYSALLWQKEATDKSPKSEKVMFVDWTWHILLPFRVLSRDTHPAERYLYQDIMILHWCQCTWQTHFAHLREISFPRVASFCPAVLCCIFPRYHLSPQKITSRLSTSITFKIVKLFALRWWNYN